MKGIKFQLEKLRQQVNQQLIMPQNQHQYRMQKLTRESYDMRYYALSSQCFQLAGMLINLCQVQHPTRSSFQSMIETIKKANKSRPIQEEQDDDEYNHRYGEESLDGFQLSKYLNTRKPLDLLKSDEERERGELYKYLAHVEGKDKDNQNFLHSMQKNKGFNLPHRKRGKSFHEESSHTQTDITWIHRRQTIFGRDETTQDLGVQGESPQFCEKCRNSLNTSSGNIQAKIEESIQEMDELKVEKDAKKKKTKNISKEKRSEETSFYNQSFNDITDRKSSNNANSKNKIGVEQNKSRKIINKRRMSQDRVNALKTQDKKVNKLSKMAEGAAEKTENSEEKQVRKERKDTKQGKQVENTINEINLVRKNKQIQRDNRMTKNRFLQPSSKKEENNRDRKQSSIKSDQKASIENKKVSISYGAQDYIKKQETEKESDEKNSQNNYLRSKDENVKKIQTDHQEKKINSQEPKELDSRQKIQSKQENSPQSLKREILYEKNSQKSTNQKQWRQNDQISSESRDKAILAQDIYYRSQILHKNNQQNEDSIMNSLHQSPNQLKKIGSWNNGIKKVGDQSSKFPQIKKTLKTQSDEKTYLSKILKKDTSKENLLYRNNYQRQSEAVSKHVDSNKIKKKISNTFHSNNLPGLQDRIAHPFHNEVIHHEIKEKFEKFLQKTEVTKGQAYEKEEELFYYLSELEKFSHTHGQSGQFPHSIMGKSRQKLYEYYINLAEKVHKKGGCGGHCKHLDRFYGLLHRSNKKNNKMFLKLPTYHIDSTKIGFFDTHSNF